MGPEGRLPDPVEVRRITAFFAWTAWTASARRPGHPYSYTNNWPPEPLVGNQLTEEAVVWSTLSIIALLGGIGAYAGGLQRYSDLLGWHGVEERRRASCRPRTWLKSPTTIAPRWSGRCRHRALS